MSNQENKAEVAILFTTQERAIVKVVADDKHVEVMMILKTFAEAMSGKLVKGVDIDSSYDAEVMITSITNGLYMIKVELEDGMVMEVNLEPAEFAKAVTGKHAIGKLI